VQNLIDIGCGDGTYTQQIKQACPWLKVKGIDLASAAITVAAKRNSKIKFSVADILKVKLKPKSAGFDVGVLRGVLHHLNDPALAIQNAFLLAERLIIIEPNGNNPLLKLIEKTSRYHLEHGERSFSTKQLRDFCEQGGGKCKKIAYIGFVPFFFPERLARILRFFQDPLEKIFPLVFFFGAQIVLICEKNRE
jgi:SAM-dependent methyltransferase